MFAAAPFLGERVPSSVLVITVMALAGVRSEDAARRAAAPAGLSRAQARSRLRSIAER